VNTLTAGYYLELLIERQFRGVLDMDVDQVTLAQYVLDGLFVRQHAANVFLYTHTHFKQDLFTVTTRT
jgi:hypothetical protein